MFMMPFYIVDIGIEYVMLTVSSNCTYVQWYNESVDSLLYMMFMMSCASLAQWWDDMISL